MAAVVAIPFPPDTSPAAQYAAMRFLIESAGLQVAATATGIGDFGPAWVNCAETVSERVMREAPNAPQSIRNEAATRYFGYLIMGSEMSGYGVVRSYGIASGAESVDFVTNYQRAWVHCGAKALLSPWKSLGAAVIRNEVEA